MPIVSSINKTTRMMGRWLNSSQFKFSALFLTPRCNIRCPYCWIPKQGNIELSTNQWKQAIDRLEQYGVIHYSLLGGEPLLRDDLEEIVRYITKKGYAATVTTNGLLLTEDRLEDLARSGLFSLVVSLDKLFGPAKGDPELAFGLLEKAKSMGITPMIHSVIMAGNEEIIPILAHETTRRGCLFSCSLYQSVGGVQSRSRNNLVPDRAKVIEAFTKIKTIKQKTGLVRTTYSYIQNLPRYFDKGWHCNPAKSTWVAVKSDGTLLACAEWQLAVSILDGEKLDKRSFYEMRKNVTDQCRGCYYECYFSEEQVFGQLRGLLAEIPRSPIFWRHLLDIFKKRVEFRRRLEAKDEKTNYYGQTFTNHK